MIRPLGLRERQILFGVAGVPEKMRREYIRLWIETGRLTEERLDEVTTNEPPSVVSMCKGLVNATTKAIKAGMTANKVVTPPVIVEERQAICTACPKHQEGWCGKCGCKLRAKIKLFTETCPLGLWKR